VAALVLLPDALEPDAQGRRKKLSGIIPFVVIASPDPSAAFTHDGVGQPLRGHRFLWLLVPPWDDVWTRQNHFTIRLAQLGAEVLYVENPFATSTLLKQREFRRTLLRTSATFVSKAPGGLTVMTPPPILPGGMHSDFIGRLNAGGWPASSKVG